MPLTHLVGRGGYRWGAIRQYRKQHAIHEFLGMKLYTEPASLLRKRVSGWASNGLYFVVPAEAIKFVAPIQFIDERHYKVFKTGDLQRDVEYKKMSRPQASFDGQYDFDLTLVLTKNVKVDRSYLTRLVVRNTS